MGPTRMLLSKPVIAAVEGFAVAGGLELALWCDLRVAARDAVFGVFCRRWGVPLVDGGTVRLPRLIGHSHALDLILTGRGRQRRRGAAHGARQPAHRARRRARGTRSSSRTELRALPQTCLREDRSSSYEQWGLGLDDAIAGRARARAARPARRASRSTGAIRFASGAGRHGDGAASRRPHGPVVESRDRCPTRPRIRHLATERTVADLMSQPVVTAQPAETVAVAAQRMREHKVGSVVVVDHDDRAIGILTERDMIRLAAAGSDASTAKVSEWMTGRSRHDRSRRRSARRVREPGRARLPAHPGRRRRRRERRHEARRHRVDARPHARRDDPARRRAGARGAEGSRRRRRRRHHRRRRARPRRLLPLPPVQRRRPREDRDRSKTSGS